MTEQILYFLKQMERAFPPPANCHHGLTYSQFGSDAAGWKERLALQINKDGKFWCFFIDDQDIENWAATVDYIRKALASVPNCPSILVHMAGPRRVKSIEIPEGGRYLCSEEMLFELGIPDEDIIERFPLSQVAIVRVTDKTEGQVRRFAERGFEAPHVV
jgi:hypothetical protein